MTKMAFDKCPIEEWQLSSHEEHWEPCLLETVILYRPEIQYALKVLAKVGKLVRQTEDLKNIQYSTNTKFC